MEKPSPERIKALADPSLRSVLVAEAERPVSRSGPLAPKDPGKLFLLPPGEARYRGVLAPGAFADVNVIDLTALRLLTPELTRDFPLGAPRYVQRADGYEATLVNGAVLAEGGELTGDLPGRVVSRSGTRPGPAARPGSPAG